MNLYVNNTKIELAPGERITLSKSVARIGEIETRSGVVSADFDVLATSVNIATLGHNNTLESDNAVSPSTKQEAYLEDEGHIISRGFVQIVSWDQRNRTISLAFFGDNADWFELLRGKFVDDIDFSDLNHDWTEANITASWTNTSGYIYPAVDYGRLTGDTNFYTEIEDWYPALFRSTIIERAFRDINYRIEGDFLETFPYQNCIIPFSRSKFERDISRLLANATDGPGVYTFSDLLVAATSGNDTQVIDIDTAVFDPEGAFNLSTNRFVATQTLTTAVFKFTFRADMTIEATGATADGEIHFKVRKNGTDILDQTLLTHSGLSQTAGSGDFVFTATEDLVATDYIDAVFYFTYSGATVGVTNMFFTVNTDSFTFDLVSVDSTIPVSGLVTLNEILPEISQLDLVKDMIVSNNLIVESDPSGGWVRFTKFDQVYDNMPDAVDWSERVDLISMRTIDFTEALSGFGVKNYFRYQEEGEDDIYLTAYAKEHDLPYGDGILTVSNDFLENEREVYESPFSATFMTDGIQNAIGTVPLAHIPYWGEDPQAIPGTPIAGYLESSARILYVIPNAAVSDFALGGAGNVKVESTFYDDCAYGYFSKQITNSDVDRYTDNLAYEQPDVAAPAGSDILGEQYSNLSRILNKPRMIEIGVRLWPHEFRDLDFTKPVYIHSGNLQGYFYIDEIDEYEGSRIPAIARLIQLV